MGCRQPLGRRDPDQQCTDEAGSAGDRDQIELGQGSAGDPQGVVDDVADQLQMVSRGDLGHDSAVAIVDPLGGDHVGEDLTLVGDDRGAGVVAACFQREDHPEAPDVDVAWVARHMIIASSPVSW